MILEVDWVSQESVGDCNNPEEPDCNGGIWRYTYTNGSVVDICRECDYSKLIKEADEKMFCKHLKSYRKDESNPRWCLKRGLAKRRLIDSSVREFCKNGEQFCFEGKYCKPVDAMDLNPAQRKHFIAIIKKEVA